MVERLLPRVRTLVHYLAAGDRDADDLVQLSLVQLLRSAGAFRGDSRLEAWADRITIRTSLRYLKRRRWREQRVCLEPHDEPAGAAGQLSAAERQQLRPHLLGLLQRLAPEQRVTVVLRLMHQYSLEEIAAVTGAPVNTVRDRLQVGRRKLRRLLVRDPVLRDWVRRRQS